MPAPSETHTAPHHVREAQGWFVFQDNSGESLIGSGVRRTGRRSQRLLFSDQQRTASRHSRDPAPVAQPASGGLRSQTYPTHSPTHTHTPPPHTHTITHTVPHWLRSPPRRLAPPCATEGQITRGSISNWYKIDLFTSLLRSAGSASGAAGTRRTRRVSRRSAAIRTHSTQIRTHTCTRTHIHTRTIPRPTGRQSVRVKFLRVLRLQSEGKFPFTISGCQWDKGSVGAGWDSGQR